MAYQAVFKRYELKYRLTVEQKEQLLEAMEPYMAMDQYGRATIRNIYFDTENYRLIRRSIEKPVYKEKMRMRSYRATGPDSPVFVELKKKYKSVVYKRRLSMKEHEAVKWLSGEGECTERSQISEEIEYFKAYYGNLKPVVYLSYEREAFYAKDGSDFRVTFDDHILCRQDKLSLEEEVGGEPVLEDGIVLMEIKTSGGVPLWMAKAMTEMHIYKTSFSKYGTAYQKMIYPKNKGGFHE